MDNALLNCKTFVLIEFQLLTRWCYVNDWYSNRASCGNHSHATWASCGMIPDDWLSEFDQTILGPLHFQKVTAQYGNGWNMWWTCLFRDSLRTAPGQGTFKPAKRESQIDILNPWPSRNLSFHNVRFQRKTVHTYHHIAPELGFATSPWYCSLHISGKATCPKAGDMGFLFPLLPTLT